MPVAELGGLKRVLVIGSNLRKDHPLIAARIRQAAKRGLQLAFINAFDDEQLIPVAARAVVAPSAMPATLAEVVKAAVTIKGGDIDAALASVTPGDAAKRIAELLCGGEPAAVFLGNFAQHHPRAATLESLAQTLARITGARFGVLGEAANSVGGYLAGALPSNGGLDAGGMINYPRRGYVLLGCEPEFDSANGAAALAALRQAEFVVALSPFQTRAVEYAHVLLPIAPFTETSGTFINAEGRVQGFKGVVQPLGETRPAWKVLRVLGNLLELDGFDYESSEQVKAEALGGTESDLSRRLDNTLAGPTSFDLSVPAQGLERIGDLPIHFADPLARRAPALQQTADARAPRAWMHGDTLAALRLSAGDQVRVSQGAGQAFLQADRDDRLPPDCVRVAAGHPSTAELGALTGLVTVERVATAALATV